MAALFGIFLAIGFAMSVADLLAFHELSMVFGYPYETATAIYWGAVVYFLAALSLAAYSDKADGYAVRWLGGLHKAASRWLWRFFWLVLLGGWLAAAIGRLTATESEHFVETTGWWWAQGVRREDDGSDTSFIPIPQRSPILRDLQTGEVFRAQDDDSDEDTSYALSRNNGVEFVLPDDAGGDYGALTIQQARVTLRRTLFGKNLILAVRYQDIDTLEAPIRHSAFCRAVASGKYRWRLWRRMVRDRRQWDELQRCPQKVLDKAAG